MADLARGETPPREDQAKVKRTLRLLLCKFVARSRTRHIVVTLLPQSVLHYVRYLLYAVNL